MRSQKPILVFAVLVTLVSAGRPSSLDVPLASADRQIRWPTKNIQIALSTSLTAPSAAIRPEADVMGAVRRALASWSSAAGVTFVEVTSKAQSVSPTDDGDGISLITVAATAENLALFTEGNTTARTRVFYNHDTGDISEADIVINPYPFSEEGEPLQFSTDGLPGTYDLESTLAHEIGHLLGLKHSHVIGATMQPSQALNGTYGFEAVSERTLSDADRAAARSLYGTHEKTGAIEGRIQNSVDGSLQPATAAHVWLEDLETGRVMASCVTGAAGRFTIDGIPSGFYRAMVEYVEDSANESALSAASERKPAPRKRAFRSVEISSRVRVGAGKTTPLNYVLVPPQNSPPSLNPRFIGLNGELSTVPVPVATGKKFTLYIGGEGVNLIPGNGIVPSSPFITIDPSTLSLQEFHHATPVISVEVSVAPNTPPGDYSIRLQANSGETAYLVGGITINPAN